MHNVLLHSTSFPVEKRRTEFCVVGGGMAGLCAALAAARRGVRTTLIQDRPVLGGNASSEVRMWICGAHGSDAKEGGILEEILLRNLYYNRGMKYTVWDDVLYGICREEPNLDLLLNCAVNEVHSEGRQLQSVKAWHLTRQCWIEVEASFWADCSGDSVLRVCGADVRWGRESSAEFGEGHAPLEADDKTMGNSILIQLREVDEHVPFVAPSWAVDFNKIGADHRDFKPKGNFWWLEFGGIMDTIGDADKIRDENLAIAYGAWDYIKNHPDGRGHGWELEWIGSLPGKRENVRYVGDHLLTQQDVEAEGRHFEDIVAHGGWTMDDHHPDAIHHPGSPTIFHPAPSPYGIPYRSLYSKDMDNLFCAGRNISATHMAMSSTRVMATTAVMGQAVGTAAAVALKKGLNCRGVYEEALDELQSLLKDDDQYLPWSTRSPVALAAGGALNASRGEVEPLLDGVERSLGQDDHGWWGEPGDHLTWTFDQEKEIGSIRIVADSDFGRTKRMPCSFPKKGNEALMPQMLLKEATLEILEDDGQWVPFEALKNNHQRHLVIPVGKKVKGIRLTTEESWGGGPTHIFAFDASPAA